MCGEHSSDEWSDYNGTGSSPHVRGAPCRRSGRLRGPWDHPRMCGEHWKASSSTAPDVGSSPHVRGALVEEGVLVGVHGIIPACAGSTNHLASPPTGEGDHPRMCGEHQVAKLQGAAVKGSSPHVRGARPSDAADVAAHGIIPACAGSTLQTLRAHGPVGGSSPHVRGAR